MKTKSELDVATHEGVLQFSEKSPELAVYVLSDGTRLISQNAVFRAFGRGKRGIRRITPTGIKVPSFMDAKNLEPFIDSELETVIKPIEFKTRKGQTVYGYKAEVVPMVCDLYLKARDAGDVLTDSQKVVAKTSEMLIRSLAKVGIIALIDEATGYQEVRHKDELKRFLAKFLQTEQEKWVKTFPDEFFEMIFKMKGWSWSLANKGKKPQVVGHYINNFVYSRLAPNVLDELRLINPKNARGNRKGKYPQFITSDFGHPLLKEHLAAVTALGRASGNNWKNFQRLLNRALPQFGKTGTLGFDEGEIVD